MFREAQNNTKLESEHWIPKLKNWSLNSEPAKSISMANWGPKIQGSENWKKIFSNFKKKLKLATHESLKLEEEENTPHPAIVVKECHLACIQVVQALISKHLLESSHLKQQSQEVQDNMELEHMYQDKDKVKVKAMRLEEELQDQQNQPHKFLTETKVEDKVTLSII